MTAFQFLTYDNNLQLPDSTLPESDHTPQLNSKMRTSLLPRNGTSACADNSNQSTMPHFGMFPFK